GFDLNFGSYFKRPVLEIAKRDYPLKRRRASRAGYVADGLCVDDNLVSVRRDLVALERKSRDALADVSAIGCHRDRLLALVASFCKTDRLLETGLQHHVGLVDVSSVHKRPRLDAHDFEHLVTYRAHPVKASLQENELPNIAKRGFEDEDVVAVRARPRPADYDRLLSGDRRLSPMKLRQIRQRLEADFLQNVRSL